MQTAGLNHHMQPGWQKKYHCAIISFIKYAQKIQITSNVKIHF